jgi:MFS family permease
VERSTIAKLRRQRGYPRFVAAATAARMADEMFSVAAVLLVLERTGSAAFAGAIVAAIMLPSLLSAPLLGAWLDLRGRRRYLMLFDQALAAVVLVAIAVLTGHVPPVVIIALATLAGVTWPLSFGGFTSLIPTLVDDELLAPANALEATSLNVALVAGPALAGVISGVASPAAALYVEAALTLASLVLILGLRALDTAPTRAAASVWAVARDGLRHLASSPPLRGVTLAGALGIGGLGLLTVALPFFCVEELGVEQNAAGHLWAAFALGSTVGALALVRLQRSVRPERVVIVALALFGVLMLTWPLAGSLGAGLALVALAGLADGPGLAATFAVRQQHAPADLQAQVFTTAAGLKVGAFALGSAVAGPIVIAAGASGAIAISALVQVAAAAIGVAAMRERRAPALEPG